MCSHKQKNTSTNGTPPGVEVTPEQVLQYLNLLVPPAEIDTFITANMHHVLPVVFQLSALKG